MKELSIEEKAKRYDEAIKLAKDSFNYPDYPGFIRADVVFPEIKESEDEKVRKELLAVINDLVLPDEQKSRFIAWLEKQSTDISSFPKEQQVFMKKYVSLDKITLIKLLAERDANNAEIIESFEKQSEQKPADKVEPIFNIGDTIAKKHNSDIHDFGFFTITDITGGKYWYNGRIICDITEQDEWEIYEPVRQKPAEWSDEDYNDIEIIACHLDNTDNEDMAEILRNIRDKYYHIILQNRWKPSKEQITWLYRAADNANKDSRMKQVLNNLLSDLKKLREE